MKRVNYYLVYVMPYIDLSDAHATKVVSKVFKY